MASSGSRFTALSAAAAPLTRAAEIAGATEIAGAQLPGAARRTDLTSLIGGQATTPSMRLDTLVPAARLATARRDSAMSTQHAAALSAASIAGAAAGAFVFNSPEAAAFAALQAPSLAGGSTAAIGASHFTGMLGRGQARIGVTSTGPEMFAASQLAGSEGAGQLVRPVEAPVTISGEVRQGYGSLGIPMDDPVLYLQLAEEAAAPAEAGLKQPTSRRAARAKKMSSGVSAALSSVSMPLSSAARLAAALQRTSVAQKQTQTQTQTLTTAAQRTAPGQAAQAAVSGAPLPVIGARQTPGRFDATTAQTAAQPGPASFDSVATRTLAAAPATTRPTLAAQLRAGSLTGAGREQLLGALKAASGAMSSASSVELTTLAVSQLRQSLASGGALTASSRAQLRAAMSRMSGDALTTSARFELDAALVAAGDETLTPETRTQIDAALATEASAGTQVSQTLRSQFQATLTAMGDTSLTPSARAERFAQLTSAAQAGGFTLTQVARAAGLTTAEATAAGIIGGRGIAIPTDGPQAHAAATAGIAGPPRSVLRTADGIVSRLTTQRVGEGFTPALASQVQAALAAGTEGLQVPGVAISASDPLFYQFSYDAETAFLRGDVDQGAPTDVAGGHVEVRDGRVVRSVPATKAAERAATMRPAGAARMGAQVAALAGVAMSGEAQQQAARLAGLSSDGIVTGQSKSVITGASQVESGFPALAISPMDSGAVTARVDVPAGASRSAAALVSSATEAELAMLPPMVREMLARQGRSAVGMTAGGTDTAGLLARLATVSDPTAPGARTAILHQLAALGVDTPELLRVLDESAAGRPAAAGGAATAGSLLRDGATDIATSHADAAVSTTAGTLSDAEIVRAVTEGAVGAGAGAEAATQLSQRLAQVVSRLTGNAALGGSELTVEQDAYWGDFAPSRMLQTGAADMLRTMLQQRGDSDASRMSALAYGAEMGELLAIQASTGTAGKPSVAAGATAAARRATATGAPTTAARAARAEQRAKRVEARRKASLAERTTAMAQAVEARSAAGQQATTDAQTSAAAAAAAGPAGALDASLVTTAPDIESFVDRVAGAVATSLSGGRVATTSLSDGAAMGWDGDALPLMAVANEPGLADRMSGAAAPWEASTASTRGKRTARGSGLPGMPGSTSGLDALSAPLLQALTDRAALDVGSAGGAGAGMADRGPIGGALRTSDTRGTSSSAPTADGVRGFASLGAAGFEQVIRSLPTSRNILQFLGGGLDMVHGVLDRANGAFAGLDAGVLRQLAQLAAANVPDGAGQEVFPGVDSWPAETLEMLQQSGWGGGDASPRRVPLSDQRVERLERRVGAAREAYARISSARDRGGRAPDQMQSVDWSLVDTGATRAAPDTADLGMLANTMVRPTSVAPTDMAMVAPAVKIVAQQAQLKPEGEAVGGGRGGGGGEAVGPGGDSKHEAKKINYDALASQIARRLGRRWQLDRDRHGRTV